MSSVIKNIKNEIRLHLKEYRLPPPDGHEAEADKRLKESFRKLPPHQACSGSKAETDWLQNALSLRQLVAKHDPRLFLQWEVINQTMFVKDGTYIERELDYLKGSVDWEQTWASAIRESEVGHPKLYAQYPESSCNLIHQAYHLARFQAETSINLLKYDIILEFGGGYGSLCRLFRNIGYTGKYIIYDMPEFSELQRYFLDLYGQKLATKKTPLNQDLNFFVSNIENLISLLSGENIAAMKTLFIATWSISESPLYIRSNLTPHLKDFSSVLIAYQEAFGEVDNVHYFQEWCRNFNKPICWKNEAIRHLPGSHYLFGY